MPLIRRLLGPTLQQAFDLDRESGPRWLHQDAVYLFSDPIQQGHAVADRELTTRQNVNDQNVWFLQTGEDEKGIIRAFTTQLRNVSGASFTVDARIVLQVPETGSTGYTDFQLWQEEVTLADNEAIWYRMGNSFPWMKDFRVPENSELRVTAWGTSGSNQQWTVRTLWDKYPADLFLAR